MATVVFHPRQALMAALAGANYVAPYLGSMEKAGIDPWEALRKSSIFSRHTSSKQKF